MNNNQRTILLFLGPPGSGKGTISQLCVEKLGYEQLSTGNLCREHIAQQSEIGKKIDLIIKSGKLIDDSLVSGMVTSWLMQNPQKRSVILDGFPRTIIQAELFNQFVADDGAQPTVVRLAVPDEIVVQRLNMRLVCSKKECQAVYSLAAHLSNPAPEDRLCTRCSAPLIRRADDELEAIKQRLKLYATYESGLLDFYRARNYPLIELEAHHAADSVFSALVQQLESHT